MPAVIVLPSRLTSHEEDRVKVKTNLAQAFWAFRGSFEPATSRAREREDQTPDSIAWLDRLFGGGLEIPESSGRALTLLLTGPPGAGKSTFAFELCHRARVLDEGPTHNEASPQRSPGPREPREPRCVYVTTESNYALMSHQRESFNWRHVKMGTAIHKSDKVPAQIVVKEMKDLGQRNWINKAIEIVKSVKGFEAPATAADQFAKKNTQKRVQQAVDKENPDIVVIDSLNVAPTEDRASLFKAYQALINEKGPRLFVLVLDTSDNPTGQEFWGYVADIIVRLDYRSTEGYMIRTLEIQKARYQSHAWGTHQLKVYGPQRPSDKAAEQRLQHPFREEGGIFIFPSIHFYLSQYKRSRHLDPEYVVTPLNDLNGMLGGGGFLKGRCVALVGDRGVHKSHLGYLHILNQLKVDPHARALIISLRDDEQIAIATMKQIMKDELEQDPKALDWDRLEVMYFPPGYITPEEFFHRVYISIQRLRSTDSSNTHNITVLFNSLDQLDARFPLCAKQQIFVPGLIEMFCAEGITSLFIGVEEPNKPEQHYGLVTVADIILKVHREYANLHFKDFDTPPVATPSGQVVVLYVQRVSGGRPAGQSGVLELVDVGDGRRELRFFGHKTLVAMAEKSKRAAEESNGEKLRAETTADSDKLQSGGAVSTTP
jgi:KaiC/GvpD/RAD55 family RecA-like ATPase